MVRQPTASVLYDDAVSWQPLPPWSPVTEPDGDALLLADEAGQPRARVIILLPDEPDDGGSALDRLSSSIDRLARQRTHAHWLRSHTLLKGQTGNVELPDGSSGAIRSGDGTDGTWLRKRYDSLVTLPDREYHLHHRSRRRSDVIRNGSVVAQLRRTGGPWIRRHDALGNLRTSYRPVTSALDGGDTLMVMLGATVLGPAGSRGLVSNLLSSLGDW